MKRWLLIALLCVLSPLGIRAQQCASGSSGTGSVTVSGNLKDAGGTNVTTQNSWARFTLAGYGGNIPRVIGTNVIVVSCKDFKPDANGNISGNIQGNDTITIGGASQPGGTSYQVCLFSQGQSFRCGNFTITGGTFNLNNATPNTTTPTIPPPTGDNTYLRRDAGNSPVIGALAINNSLVVKQINGSLVVDASCLTNWGTADLGACINAAYAAGPASGVDILVSPTPNGNGNGCTNYSTPIAFTTPHKPAFLHGSPGQIVCLNYTPTTGTMATFDTGNTLTGNAGLGPGYGYGMSGILLNGPSASGSVVGIAIGTSNGSEGLVFEKGGILNVGTALTFGGGINFFQKFKDFVIGPTNLAFNLTVAIENLDFDHVKFECSFSGPTSACIQFTAPSGLSHVNFNDVSLDNSNVSVNSSCGPTCIFVAFDKLHQEVTANSTLDLFNIQGGTVSIHKSELKYGPTSGSAPGELITCNTGNCSLSLGGNHYDAGESIASVVNQATSADVVALGDVFVSPNFGKFLISDNNPSQISISLPAQGPHYNLPKIIYDTQSSATNNNIPTVTMATQGTGLAVSTTYRVSFYVALVTPGTSCTGTSTVNLNLLYTDPNGAGQQTLATTLNIAVNSNGTAGNIIFPSSGPPQIPTWIINAKSGSTIQWSTTSFAAGSGCSPAPTYQVTPRLETM